MSTAQTALLRQFQDPTSVSPHVKSLVYPRLWGILLAVVIPRDLAFNAAFCKVMICAEAFVREQQRRTVNLLSVIRVVIAVE